MNPNDVAVCNACGGTLFYIEGKAGQPLNKISTSKCIMCGSSEIIFPTNSKKRGSEKT